MKKFLNADTPLPIIITSNVIGGIVCMLTNLRLEYSILWLVGQCTASYLVHSEYKNRLNRRMAQDKINNLKPKNVQLNQQTNSQQPSKDAGRAEDDLEINLLASSLGITDVSCISKKEVKHAYHRKMKALHPDHRGNMTTTDKNRNLADIVILKKNHSRLMEILNEK